MERSETGQRSTAGNFLLLQDVDHYLESNGILQGQEESNYQQLDQVEFAANVDAEKKHQLEIIGKMIQQDEENDRSSQQDSIQKKKQMLEKCRGIHITVSTVSALRNMDVEDALTNGNTDEEFCEARKKRVLLKMPLYDLVDQCDTLFSLVSSDFWSSLHEQDQNKYVFSLDQFDAEAVTQIMHILNRSARYEHFTVMDITSENIIECCYIAHYLQSNDVLNDIVDIIKESVDSTNCTSICTLADELQIPSLLQTSMGYVMESLDDIREDQELWNDVPTSLQNHIITLRNAAHSSIVGCGNLNTRKTAFSSGHEFLALFHDTLTMNKERLLEAKQRQREIIEERMKDSSAAGRFTRRFLKQKDGCDTDLEYAALKIEKQERRVQTLQAFYREQKAIFAQDAKIGEGRYRGAFHL